jgi:hypothetical protein
MQMETPPVKWAVQDMLPEGLAVLAGKPKLGKSWLALELGISIAEGGIVMGSVPVESGDVLMLALEDNPRRLKNRFRTLLGDEPAPERLYMETQWPRENEGGLEAIAAWLGQHPAARLVVIDTLVRFRAQGGETGYSQDSASIEGLHTLAKLHGVAILAITHFRKALSEDGDWIDQITGTLGIAGIADTLWGLVRKRGSGAALLRIDGRDVEQGDKALEHDPPQGQWWVIVADNAEEYEMGRETQAVILAMEGIGGPANINTIASLSGKKRATTARLLQRAAKSGLVMSYGNGMYGVRPSDLSVVQ